MHERFDRRVLPEAALSLIRRCQGAVECHLGGGAALSGAWLSHRLTRDVDLFCHDRQAHRDLASALPGIATSEGFSCRIVRDAATHVLAHAERSEFSLAIDIVYESISDLEPPPDPVDGIVVESLTDIRAAKLTCILSRSEPRDLVDLLFLDRAGYPPHLDLKNALRKDAGIDPGIMAWLLKSFPVEPLPAMLQTLSVENLRTFRDELAQRMKAVSII